MNSASAPQTSTGPSSKSCFRKTVCLADWWLEKPESNSWDTPLTIAGTTSREFNAVRSFSAPISKRYDDRTLETVDGVFVLIRGLMNKTRTEANGFSSEIGKHFLFGFPSDWTDCAKKFYRGEIPLPNVSDRSQDYVPLSPLPSILDSIVKSPQRENSHGRLKNCTPKNLKERFQSSLLSPCQMTTKGVPKKPVPASEEEVNKIESCKKSLTEHFLGSPPVLEVKTHPVSNVIMSEDGDIVPKSGTVVGDDAIANAQAIPAYKSRGRGRPSLKQTANTNETTITPPIRPTRRDLSSTRKKQKKNEVGSIKQSISQNATLRSGKPENKSKYESSTSRKREDESSDVSCLSPNAKRSRSGRLLLPKLEFWRDQRAIYDPKGQITAVKDLNLDAFAEGNKS